EPAIGDAQARGVVAHDTVDILWAVGSLGVDSVPVSLSRRLFRYALPRRRGRWAGRLWWRLWCQRGHRYLPLAHALDFTDPHCLPPVPSRGCGPLDISASAPAPSWCWAPSTRV